MHENTILNRLRGPANLKARKRYHSLKKHLQYAKCSICALYKQYGIMIVKGDFFEHVRDVVNDPVFGSFTIWRTYWPTIPDPMATTWPMFVHQLRTRWPICGVLENNLLTGCGFLPACQSWSGKTSHAYLSIRTKPRRSSVDKYVQYPLQKKEDY